MCNNEVAFPTPPNIFGITTRTNVDPTSSTTRQVKTIKKRYSITKDSNKIGKLTAAKVRGGLRTFAARHSSKIRLKCETHFRKEGDSVINRIL